MRPDFSYGFRRRDVCPACGFSSLETLYSSPFEQGGIGCFVRNYYRIDPAQLSLAPYELVRCQSCTLLFQRFVGDDDLLSDLYTHWVDEPDDPEQIPTYREEIEAVALSRDAHELMAAASCLGVPLNQLLTLDFGMGWALWARIAAQLGCESYGFDLATPRMEFARAHGVRTLDDISHHGFHFINTEQVFEHVPDPGALARKLAASLLPGGILKVSVPSGETASKLVRMLNSGLYAGDYETIIPVQPLEHVNCFTRRSVARLGALAGLEPLLPRLRHRYVFLKHPGTLRLTRPKKALKEIVRPVYQYHNPTNIYAWFRKPV